MDDNGIGVEGKYKSTGAMQMCNDTLSFSRIAPVPNDTSALCGEA